MFDAGCLSDPTTNSYCYVSAVANSNPSDVYFYNLPLGFNLPNSTASTCSACTKSLLGLYAAGLGSSTGSTLTGLRKTYQNAVGVAQSQCGQAYAHMADTAGAAGLRAGMGSVWGVVVVLLAGWSILP
jgi:hypothetical protein